MPYQALMRFPLFLATVLTSLILTSCSSTPTSNAVSSSELSAGGTYYPLRDYVSFYLQPNFSRFDAPYSQLFQRERLILRAFDDTEARVELPDGTVGYIEVGQLGKRPATSGKPRSRKSAPAPKKRASATTSKPAPKATPSKPKPVVTSRRPEIIPVPNPPKTTNIPSPPPVLNLPPRPTKEPGLREGSIDDLDIQRFE